MSDPDCGAVGTCFVIKSDAVTYLCLYNNQLESSGFRSLASTLHRSITTTYPKPSTVQTLDLAGNGADPDSVVWFLMSVLDLIVATADGGHNALPH